MSCYHFGYLVCRPGRADRLAADLDRAAAQGLSHCHFHARRFFSKKLKIHSDRRLVLVRGLVVDRVLEQKIVPSRAGKNRAVVHAAKNVLRKILDRVPEAKERNQSARNPDPDLVRAREAGQKRSNEKNRDLDLDRREKRRTDGIRAPGKTQDPPAADGRRKDAILEASRQRPRQRRNRKRKRKGAEAAANQKRERRRRKVDPEAAPKERSPRNPGNQVICLISILGRRHF